MFPQLRIKAAVGNWEYWTYKIRGAWGHHVGPSVSNGSQSSERLDRQYRDN